MRISIQFDVGPLTPMEVPVVRAGIGEPFDFSRAGQTAGGVRLLKLRRRTLRNWNRLFIPLEPPGENFAQAA